MKEKNAPENQFQSITTLIIFVFFCVKCLNLPNYFNQNTINCYQ